MKASVTVTAKLLVRVIQRHMCRLEKRRKALEAQIASVNEVPHIKENLPQGDLQALTQVEHCVLNFRARYEHLRAYRDAYAEAVHREVVVQVPALLYARLSVSEDLEAVVVDLSRVHQLAVKEAN